MLKEALEFVQGRMNEARTAKIIPIPGEPRKVLVQHLERLDQFDVPPPLRHHTARRLEDFCAAAARLGGEKLTVWHDGKTPREDDDECEFTLPAIVGLIDDADRRERITLPLEQTAAFNSVERLGRSGRYFKQPELIRLLQFDLATSFQDPTLISLLRKLKFRNASTASADLQHGRESLGREIEGEITGAGALPEQIELHLSVYANPPLDEDEVNVRLCLFVDVANERFHLQPFPEEILNARHWTHERIRERLEKLLPKETPICHGTP